MFRNVLAIYNGSYALTFLFIFIFTQIIDD